MRSREIAEWFLRHEADTSSRSTITNMKLQKLVYLAESCYGSLYGERLLDEPIQAWEHGPAVKPLFGAYKHNGSRAIPAPEYGPDLPEAVTEVLETVWDTFGSMTPAQLRALTHDLGPYEDHFRSGVRDILLPATQVHGAWPEFLDDGTSRQCRVDSSAVGALRRLLDCKTDAHAEGETVDTDQLMTDFRAFAVAR